ncbi:MAG TPA: hypothetical protein VFL29_13300 [Candidatus Dormibacteraeota bacterium]|nr:hypothetical protein [Candidatus Dormibacteraeota bacterium]
MNREDFRRELRDGFESIAGPPEAGLAGRVHAALVEAPERRGPVWIAGLAAVLIAALAVGALFIAGPLRQQNPPVPGLTETPSPLPTSDVSNLPAITCNNLSSVDTTGHIGQPIAYVNGVRTATHAGYDRITIQFSNGLPGDIQIATQGSATFTQGASGRQVVLQGSAGLLVTMTGADENTKYTGSTDFKTSYPVMVEAQQVQNFEGVVQWGIGLSHSACYRAFVLQGPDRLVIDFANT